MRSRTRATAASSKHTCRCPIDAPVKRETAAAYVALALLSTIWGYNWVVIKIAARGADPFTLGALRSVLASLFLFGTLLATRRSLRSPAVGPTIVLGLLQTTLFTVFQLSAVASGGAGKTAVLAYTMPFWTALLAWPFLGERVRTHGAIALILAAAGIALVLSPIDLSGGLLSKLFAVLAAVAWAASAIYAKRMRARHPTELLSLTTWQLAYGTVPLAVVALLMPVHHLVVNVSFVVALAYLALPAGAVAWVLWLFILGRLSAGVAGVASLLTPVIGVAAAWLQLGERPSGLELAGIACIVGALVVNGIAPGEQSTALAGEPS